MIIGAFSDVRFAIRQYRKHPWFALLAVLTLAFGIGATTAVYSVVHAVLLRPLPFADSDTLVMAWDAAPEDGDRFKAMMASPEDIREYMRSSTLLDRITYSARIRPVLHRSDIARRTIAGLVTLGMFRDTLGSKAWLGRTFVNEDQNAGCVVVLAYGFWNRVLRAERSLVGRSLRFDETDCTVVGVMPQGFDLFPVEAEMWFLRDHAPVAAVEAIRRVGYLERGIVYARLRPGATAVQAEAELTGLHRARYATGRQPSPSDGGERGHVVAVEPVRTAIMGVVAPTLDRSLWLALGAVVLLLLIACVNVANLLLARLAERRRELVVRSALGSGRARLVRQMLMEGAVLALAGTILGIAFASAGVEWFRYLSPFTLPTQAGDVSLNVRVLLFAVGLSFATTLLFALLPALAGSSVDINQGLRAVGRGFFGSAGSGRMARMMVAVEMALSFMLLTGAALFMNSTLRLQDEELGYDVSNIAMAYADLPGERYPTQESRDSVEGSLRERLEAIPGVGQVVFGSLPPDSDGGQLQVEVRGRPLEPVFDVSMIPASREYFELLHVPLRRGRMFADADRTGPALAIVSQRFVDQYMAGENPVGRAIRVIDGDSRGEWRTVVGVIGAWKHMVDNTAWRDTAAVFTIGGPSHIDDGYGVGIGVRTNRDAGLIAEQIRKQILTMEPNAVLTDIESPAGRLNSMLAYSRFRAVLLIAFGIGALLLSAVGLHGVIAQIVSQRMPEFAIRSAVGAEPIDLAWLAARQGGIAIAAGLAAGWMGAFAAARIVETLLYGVQMSDPHILAISASALILSALLAILLPTIRAARVSPLNALREQ